VQSGWNLPTFQGRLLLMETYSAPGETWTSQGHLPRHSLLTERRISKRSCEGHSRSPRSREFDQFLKMSTGSTAQLRFSFCVLQKWGWHRSLRAISIHQFRTPHNSNKLS
jgi:hypothetical protein